MEKNRERDARAVAKLAALGWASTTIWECETRTPDSLPKRISAFLKRSLDLCEGVSEGAREGVEDAECR